MFDYVITVCDNARETCPVFFGVARKLHHDFGDPAAATGPHEQLLAAFRRVRDELRTDLAEIRPRNTRAHQRVVSGATRFIDTTGWN